MSVDRRTLLKAAAAAPFLLRPALASPQGRPPQDQFVLVDALHTLSLLDAVREAASRIRAKGRAGSAGDVQVFLQLAGRLRKEFAATPAARQALEIAAGLGIRLPD